MANSMKEGNVTRTRTYLIVSCCVLLAGITLNYLDFLNTPTNDYDEDIKSDGLNQYSMFDEYTYYWNLSERLGNLEKYDYSHSKHGIDRRSNFSLQEFHDVYDNKW